MDRNLLHISYEGRNPRRPVAGARSSRCSSPRRIARERSRHGGSELVIGFERGAAGVSLDGRDLVARRLCYWDGLNQTRGRAWCRAGSTS